MPFYDLRCTSCDRDFNIMASMSDKAERRIPCPECGSMEMTTVYKSAPYYIKGRGDTPAVCPNSRACGMSCPHSHGTS